MKSKYFPYHHLLAALLCLTAAAMLNIYALLREPGTSQNDKIITENISEALRKATLDMNMVKPYLAGDTVNFHDLLNNKTYFPTFIFKYNQAVFWTEHTLVVDFITETPLDKPRVIESKFGKFLMSGTKYGPYTIQVCIPLEKQYGINNKYLDSGLNENIFESQKVRIVQDPSTNFPRITYQNQYLFSVEPLTENTAHIVSNAAIALISLGLVFLIWGLIKISRSLTREGEFLKATALLVLPLLSIRMVLLYYNFPFSVLELDVFDPKLYAASFWSPSIGDLFLNGVLLLVFATHFNGLFRRRRVTQFLKGLSNQRQFIIKLVCVLAFYVALLALYFVYYSSFSNSLLVMDVTQSIQYSLYKVFLYGAFVIYSIIFLIIGHLCIQVFYYLHDNTTRQNNWYATLGLSGALLVITGSFLNNILIILLGVSLLFYLAILFSKYRRNISSNPFQNYLFIFWIIGISAVAGSLAIYQHYLWQLVDNKSKFAADILTERDIQGEYLLEDISRAISGDDFIKTKITDASANKNDIQDKIVRHYLADYFDNYDTSIKIFGSSDSLADVSGQNYTLRDYLENYLEGAKTTAHSDLYLIKTAGQLNSRKYIKLVKLRDDHNLPATIVLELTLKELSPNSVIPELLVDQKNFQPLFNRDFSYAFYRGGKYDNGEGNFEYVHSFNNKILSDKELYREGLHLQGFHHWAVQGRDNLILVISTAQYSLADITSNFSFLFLVHTLVFLVYMLAFLIIRGGFRQALNTNFSTKIQLFLNFGILIPLLIVSVATASLVTASYKRDLQDMYEKRGRLVQENILNSWSWADYRSNKEALREEVADIAALAETDINLYDNGGKLIISSQQMIFDKGLLSKYINPEAFADIAENNAQRVLLREKTGNITFNALYLPLPSAHKTVDGFIGIPFFDSEKELHSKLIYLLTTIMNIFTAMFILFMVVTNWAAKALTVPLKLVTQKLKQTTLTGGNEKLVYESADEIGLLVNEYNQMLLKLEESKNELATREKEAAWREMARQVAHEIKNPLTPMKLSLQYLQKAIAEKRENMEALISKIAQTLITQIEILSDIATSFSNFTALPELKPEPIDIANSLRQSVNLHQETGKVELTTEIEPGTFVVLADENILMRTFNNLLINAEQAVPAGRTPEIKVSLHALDKKVRITFTDNGSGVPAEIRHKIFVPNFSTKFTGSGIGLAVAKKGIESAGGNIWFETVEGEGTTFFIELPLVQE